MIPLIIFKIWYDPVNHIQFYPDQQNPEIILHVKCKFLQVVAKSNNFLAKESFEKTFCFQEFIIENFNLQVLLKADIHTDAHNWFLLKCKISTIWLVETAYFDCYNPNINGMWNVRKLDEIYKAFEFILT